VSAVMSLISLRQRGEHKAYSKRESGSRGGIGKSRSPHKPKGEGIRIGPLLRKNGTRAKRGRDGRMVTRVQCKERRPEVDEAGPNSCPGHSQEV